MRRGFSELPLAPNLRIFTVFELMSLVCGKQVMQSMSLARLENSRGVHSACLENESRFCLPLNFFPPFLLDGIFKTLSAEDLLGRVVFRGYGPQSRTPAMLRAVLRGYSDTLRLKFLSLVTASTALPVRFIEGGVESGFISVWFAAWGSDRLPLAHTCFDQLDLPEYPSEDVLRDKLTSCHENLEMAGFGES